MTAPTPEQAAAVRWLTSVAQFGRRTEITKEQAAAICGFLAAVTAERDQARQLLADAPHERGCGMTRLPGYLHSGECFCWKAGL